LAGEGAVDFCRALMLHRFRGDDGKRLESLQQRLRQIVGVD
jgi:hypothetical protein